MGFSDSHLIPLVDEGLGNSAYLVDLGDGQALAVDASRDLRALRSAAARRGLTVAFAADTHLHADFLSGAVQLHHDTGATILASAAGRARSIMSGSPTVIRSIWAACGCRRWPLPGIPTSTSLSC